MFDSSSKVISHWNSYIIILHWNSYIIFRFTVTVVSLLTWIFALALKYLFSKLDLNRTIF